jgi:hypothetical protein
VSERNGRQQAVYTRALGEAFVDLTPHKWLFVPLADGHENA